MWSEFTPSRRLTLDLIFTHLTASYEKYASDKKLQYDIGTSLSLIRINPALPYIRIIETDTTIYSIAFFS